MALFFEPGLNEGNDGKATTTISLAPTVLQDVWSDFQENADGDRAKELYESDGEVRI